MSDPLISVLKKYGEIVSYEPNFVLLEPGDAKKTLFYIVEGRTKLSTIGLDGGQKTIYHLDEGSFICELDFFLGCSSTLLVETETKCLILEIGFKDYDNAWQESAIIRDSIVKSLSRKVRYLQEEINKLSFLSVRTRILSYLYSIRNESDIKVDWLPLKYEYTQSEIAENIGSNRSTVNRELRKLYSLGVLRKLNNRIEINKDFAKKYLCE